MAGRNGHRGGLSVLWIPKKKHGHKKEKFYRPQAEKTSQRSSGSGLFPAGSPYSRRRHQGEPEWPIASGSTAAVPVQAAVVVEQQANGTAPPRTEPALERADASATGPFNASTENHDKGSLSKRNQEEVIEMAEATTDNQAVGPMTDSDAFMNNTNNNKSNGHLDRVDSALMRKKKKKRKNKKMDGEETVAGGVDKGDDCGIRCLSYALQCCECVIS